jgi:alpha-1,2-mannosyltransferase
MSSMTISSCEHSLRRRLWKCGSLLAIFILTIAVANFFAPADRAITRQTLGHDFLVFYTAGAMARHGDFHDLYDLSAIKTAEAPTARAAGLSTGFGPYWNPPFAAWLFAPFSSLPFGEALVLWYFASAAALAASIILLTRFLPRGGEWRNWGLIALLLLTSMPLIAVFTHGQNSCLTLLLMTIVAALWRSRRAVLAGAAAGLLLYKPQHAAIIALVLALSLGWRAAAGTAFVAASLAIITLLTMPGAAGDYLHKLPQILAVMQEQSAYAWDRHVTLKAFWRLLFQGTDAGPTRWPAWIGWWMSELVVAALLVRVIRQARRDPSQTDRLIATTIAASPLLVPFCLDYDLLILAVPAVLCAGRFMRQGSDRRLLAAWIALYAAMHLSVFVARPAHFAPAVPALAAVVACLAYPRRTHAAAQSEPVFEPTALAA